MNLTCCHDHPHKLHCGDVACEGEHMWANLAYSTGDSKLNNVVNDLRMSGDESQSIVVLVGEEEGCGVKG